MKEQLPPPEDSMETTLRLGSKDPNDLSGVLLGQRYRLQKLIGQGGMSRVYEAVHITLGKIVAIKVLNHELCETPQIAERFVQEARAAIQIQHDNVVDILDFGEAPGGSVYFVMELLKGEDLGALLNREGAIPWHRARVIVIQICLALAAAHAEGIVHRDIKPENIFRIKKGRNHDFVKVLDFGIAKIFDEGTGPKLTQTGAIFGTAEYMSPEQALGEVIDLRTDIYSVGILLYELVTGDVPFRAETFIGCLTRHLTDPVPSVRAVAPEAQIPEPLEALICKALAKARDDRYGSIQEFAHDLGDLVLSGTETLPALPVLSPPSSSTSAPVPDTVPPDTVPPQGALFSRNVLIGALAGLAALVVALVLVVIYLSTRAQTTSIAEVDAPANVSEPQPLTYPLILPVPTPMLESEPTPPEPEPESKANAKPKKKKKKLPEKLLESHIKSRRSRIGIHVRTCLTSTSRLEPGQKVAIEFSVEGKTGKVIATKVITDTIHPIGVSCIEREAKKVRFPRFKKTTQSFIYKLRL